MNFSFPERLTKSIISELENYIIYLCNTYKTFPELSFQSTSLWDWAGRMLQKTPQELRREIETHEAHEHFTDEYHAEKDHLLKLPLLILEALNPEDF